MIQEIYIDGKGNKILGNNPILERSSVNFFGNNNILFCDDHVRLNGTTINFNGNNSLIFLGSCNKYNIDIDIFNNSVIHIGKSSYFNKNLKVIISECKHCFIGDHCIFSADVIIRNSDAHLIYTCDTKMRINMTESIYIGDHVWIGQYVNILKGTQIDSGSVIGASSVVAGKKIPHNTIWAGSPARQIKEDIFWDKSCVHGFTEEMTEASMNYTDFLSKKIEGCQVDYWTYQYKEDETIEWSTLAAVFSKGNCLDKCDFLIMMNSNRAKNRFVH